MNDNDPRMPLVALVKKHGPDPEWLVEEGLSDEGDYTVVRGDASIARKRALAGDETAKAWAAWPPELLAEPTFAEAVSAAVQRILLPYGKEKS